MRQSRSASWVFTGVLLALLTFFTASLAAVLLLYVPGQKRIFDEYGVRLPTLTIWVLRSSSYVAQYWWFLVPVVMLALCGPVLLARHVLGWRVTGTVFALTALTLLVLFGLLIPVAVIQPMTDLQRGLAK